MTSANSADHWHGYLLAGRTDVPTPTCITSAEGQLARKDCKTGITASEYMDSEEVLRLKAAVMLRMWINARKPTIFSGAGISTSSGINDYASSASNSVAQPKAPMRLTMDNIHNLRPTVCHCVIAAMEQLGLVWGWLQQNHDGLAQKAGFPSRKCNEIHGCWLDSEKNPIIAMSGNLRSDMFDWCLEMEKQADFVLGVGTSYSGLNADRVSHTVGERHLKAFNGEQKKHKGGALNPFTDLPPFAGQGLAILSLQKTPLDSTAALRVFAKIDHFMLIVAEEMCNIVAQSMGAQSREFAAQLFARNGIIVDNKHQSPCRFAPVRPVQYTPTPLPVGPPTDNDWFAEQRNERNHWLGNGLSAVDTELKRYIATPLFGTQSTGLAIPEEAFIDPCAQRILPPPTFSQQQESKVATHASQQQSSSFVVSIGNTHKNRADGTHDWCMYVKPLSHTTATLLKAVTYTLHPTFQNPVRKVSVDESRKPDHSFSFPLRCSGWGTFAVKVSLSFEGRDPVDRRSFVTKQVDFEHMLSFDGDEASTQHSFVLPFRAVE